ncbi:hypothetical protein C8K63_10638 [Pseudomonas sp. GV085]|jgi:2,4-dienoyl-CoA reductase-like NADH-dependent reductase (Old Yellow Enzyme family)|nr:hypothetical protein C8K63_10638 [Pseudomonas sp. GV085]
MSPFRTLKLPNGQTIGNRIAKAPMEENLAMTGPGGIAREDERHLERFRQWASVGRAGGAHF